MLTLTTADPRLILSQLRPEDAAEHFAVIDSNRQHLACWLPWARQTRSERDVAGFIAVSIAQWQGRQALACALRLESQIIGGIGIVEMDAAAQTASLGYWLDAAHCGCGHMTRAVEALRHYCLDALDCQRVHIRAAVANTASRRLAERLGFTLESIEPAAIVIDGQAHDAANYVWQC